MQTINSNIPSSVYSAGNVRFDSTPFTRYYLETQARNQAKDEAFIKSFQNLVSSVTPAGMAANDIPSFMKKKQDWINYIIQNKKAYENPSLDNGDAYGQAMTKYNQILSHAETSKDKVKSIASLNSLMQNPDRKKLLTTDFMQKYHTALLPVDEGYQPLDMGSIDFNAKPFEQKDLQAFDNTVKSLVAPSLKNNKKYDDTKIRIDKESGLKFTPFSVKLTGDDYTNISAYANQLYNASSSFSSFVDNEFNNPVDHALMNQVYKNHLGKDANIETPQDMAEAVALSRVSPELNGEEKSNYTDVLGNFYAEQAQRMNDFYKREQYKQDNPTASGSGSTWVQDMTDAANNGDVEQLKNTASQLFAANPNYVKLKGTPHIKDNTLYFDYQENQFDANANDKKGGYVWKDKVMSLPLDKVNIPETKAKMAAFQQKFLGTSQKVKNAPYYKGSTTSGKAQSYKATDGKNYTHSDLLKIGYTEEQIQQAIKLGNLK